MKLITKQAKANGAAERWIAQYGNSKMDIFNRLKALGENPSPKDIAKIIGNWSWTDTPCCSECGADEVPVIEVGDEPDYESDTAWLCKSCVKLALEKFD